MAARPSGPFADGLGWGDPGPSEVQSVSPLLPCTERTSRTTQGLTRCPVPCPVQAMAANAENKKRKVLADPELNAQPSPICVRPPPVAPVRPRFVESIERAMQRPTGLRAHTVDSRDPLAETERERQAAVEPRVYPASEPRAPLFMPKPNPGGALEADAAPPPMRVWPFAAPTLHSIAARTVADATMQRLAQADRI